MNPFEAFFRYIRQQDRIDSLTIEKENYLNELNYSIDKIKALNDLQYNYEKDKVLLAQQKAELEVKVTSLNWEITKRDTAIDSLKVELAMTGIIDAPIPDYLDTTKLSYKPYVNALGTDLYLRPESIYDLDIVIKEMIKNTPKLKTMTKNQKLMWIWDYVAKAIKYKKDTDNNLQIVVVDYWFPAYWAILRGFDDCEGGTTIFIVLCKLLGFRPDEVYNQVGWFSNLGLHSYPIAKFDFDEILGTDGKSWYVCESTLDFIPPRPLNLAGSKYIGDLSYGIANWRFSGRIKPEHAAEFNCAGTGAAGDAAKSEKINHSQEKRDSIKEYWKQVK